MPSFTRPGLGAWLILVLVLLSVLFAGVVWLSTQDAERMAAAAQARIDIQNVERREVIEEWRDAVLREHARQLAAPFLWDVESLEGFEEGTPEFERLQRRMWLFVYGRARRPAWEEGHAGPLESVVVIDLQGRIVAASDPMVVDQRFTRSGELERLMAALDAPQLETLGPRPDGQPVSQLTVAVPNSAGEPIGFVRLRYVGSTLQEAPSIPQVVVSAEPRYLGPLLAGLLALLGVGFGALATWQVVGLTRRLEAVAGGRLRAGGAAARARASGGRPERALSLIEERLEALSSNLRRDDALLASLTEALREGVILVDPDARALVANRLAADALGLPIAETRAEASAEAAGDASLANAFARLLERNEELRGIVRAAVEERRAVRERRLTIEHDGTRQVVQVTSYVVHDGVTVSGVLLLIKDRDSIALLERNLTEASRQQAISGLTGSVAHEVKNPLGAMGIHLEHLRRRLSKGDTADPVSAERIGVIREEIGRLREILEEWLRLTGPEERAVAQADVGDVLSSVGRLLRVEARHRGVELVVETPGEALHVPLSDARLKQVVLNIALNGLEAMEGGGRLTLSSRESGHFAMIEVEDSGPGIPAAYRERIFELHFTTREKGSGLGLAICRRIVEEAGGHIALVSRIGIGTIFRIVLPVASLRRNALEAGQRRALSARGAAAGQAESG